MTNSTELPYARITRMMATRWPSKYPSAQSVTQDQVAKLAGVKQSSVHKWTRGGPISHGVVIDLAVKLGVAVEWLETGRGAQYPTDGDVMFHALWSAWWAMDEPQRMELLRYAEYLRGAAHSAAG